MGDLIKHDVNGSELPAMTTEAISIVVRDIMGPLLESIGTLLRHNTEAMEQIAAAQQLTSERMAELEKRVRLQTPMSRAQEKYVNDAIRARARELLEAKGIENDKRAVNRLGGMIRKSVLTRYGVSCLREYPAYEYEVCLKQIAMWNDIMAIRDVAKEARKREATALAEAQRLEGQAR